MFVILIPLGLIAFLLTIFLVVLITGWLLSSSTGTVFLVFFVLWILWMIFWHATGRGRR